MSTSATAVTGFEATLTTVGPVTMIRLPKDASGRLPSRGQVAVRGTLNDRPFETVLEPDGLRGHWMRIEPGLQAAAGVEDGEPVTVTLEIRPDWPEPDVPADLNEALAAAPEEIRDVWGDITPMARWEWVRWINATANPATRQRRVEVSISKMGNGKRRPCCFDLSACSDPSVSTSGRLRAT